MSRLLGSWSRSLALVLAGAVIGLGALPFAPAGAQPSDGAAWLDATTPTPWNVPGATLPTAPPLDPATDPRFLERARPAETPIDRALTAAGWQLVGAYQAGWGVTIVQATSGYDGMGRPNGYQAFVFFEGRYAGTLAPAPMNARTDGSLRQVFLFGLDQITAQFNRYRPSDPLCCPSGEAAVAYRIEQTAEGPIVTPTAITSATTPSAGAPAAPSTPPSSGGTTERPPLGGDPTPLLNGEWQWLRSQFNDDTAFTPDDPGRYTLTFQADGTVAFRADCNVGRGSFNLREREIGITVQALTRAFCPPPSLSETYLEHLRRVARFSIIDGDLVLEFPFDSGTMRFRRAVAG